MREHHIVSKTKIVSLITLLEEVPDPRMARSLIGHIFEAGHGESIYRKASIFTGKLGQKVADESVTIIDDAVARIHVHHAPVPEMVLSLVPAGSHVLIMTHDHAEDAALCDAALRTPGLASIDEPAPHHCAHRAASVKNEKTVLGLARMTTVRSTVNSDFMCSARAARG